MSTMRSFGTIGRPLLRCVRLRFPGRAARKTERASRRAIAGCRTDPRRRSERGPAHRLESVAEPVGSDSGRKGCHQGRRRRHSQSAAEARTAGGATSGPSTSGHHTIPPPPHRHDSLRMVGGRHQRRVAARLFGTPHRPRRLAAVLRLHLLWSLTPVAQPASDPRPSSRHRARP